MEKPFAEAATRGASFKRAGSTSLVMWACALVADGHLALGEPAVPEKTSEIAAIPELLDLIDAEGRGMAAIGAMGRQKAIPKKIGGKKAAHAIALKESQRALCGDARLLTGLGRKWSLWRLLTMITGAPARRERRLLPAASQLRKEWKGPRALRAGGLQSLGGRGQGHSGGKRAS